MSTILNELIVGKRQSVTEDYLLLDPSQIPVISELGFGTAATQTKHEWFEDVMYPTATLVNGALTATATSIVVDDVTPFTANSIAQVDDEFVFISAIDEGTKTLTVTRGYAGTTAATHDDDADIEFKFCESKEAQDARAARYNARAYNENYTQIFTETVCISGTAGAVTQYGVVSEYEKERMKKETELFLQLEKAILGGVKYKSTDGINRYLGGMKCFVSTNVVDASAASVSVELLRELTKTVDLAGGFKRGKQGYKFMMHPTQIEKISDIMVSSNGTQERSDTARGYTATSIVTPQGTFPILENGNMKENEIMFIDFSRIEIKPLVSRDFGHTYLGVKGDYQEGMLVGEYTFEFHEEKAHAWLKNLAV